MTKKMINFRIDINLLDKLNKLDESKTDVIQKALEMYIQSKGDVNTSYKESVNTKRNTTVNTHQQTVNHNQQEKQEKPVNQVNHTVNHKLQVTENHELIEYLKRNEEWLKDRIEHFENTQDKIFEKLDAKDKKETEISWYRM